MLLTTNRDTSIDEAFRRRLRFRIEFPTPELHEREQLWRSMIPETAPLGADVDFRRLAERFEMTGGYIKNAAMRAAYLAATSKQKIISRRCWSGPPGSNGRRWASCSLRPCDVPHGAGSGTRVSAHCYMSHAVRHSGEGSVGICRTRLPVRSNARTS